MRRHLAVLPALALSVALTGCGGGDDEESEPTAAPTTAATTAPAATPTETRKASPSVSASASSDPVARAKRLAPKINLMASDLPGFTSEPAEPDSGDDEDDLPPTALAAAAKCLGLSAGDTEEFFNNEVDESEVDSPDFSRGELPGVQLSSTVDVSEDGGVDGAAFKRFFPVVFSQKGASCLGPLFETAISAGLGAAGKVSVDSASVFDVPALAGQKAGGLRAALIAVVEGKEVSFELNIVAIYQEDVAVTLLAAGAGQDVPRASLNTLAATLGKRLAANV